MKIKNQNIINIKHITFVINLKNTKASDYLMFKDKVELILKTNSKKTVQFNLFNNQYAILYVLPSGKEKTVIKEVVNCITNVKLDYIVIDELFPENNEYFFNNIRLPQTAKWIKNKNFDSKESFIEVK
jgi:hypothetical protein